MYTCPPAIVMHNDIIGFDTDQGYLVGSVRYISTRKYPDNKYRPIEWIIHIETKERKTINAVFDSTDRIDLFHMYDSQNPARTRNNTENWSQLGIKLKESK